MAIVVTGGTRGIGLAIAKRLAKPGTRLVLGYHGDEEAAARARDEIERQGAVVTTMKSDIGSVEGCRALIDAAVRAGMAWIT